MDISNSVALVQSSASLAPLRAANKQPELALQLILNTLAGTQETSSAQASPGQVLAPSSTSGQHINIKA